MTEHEVDEAESLAVNDEDDDRVVHSDIQTPGEDPRNVVRAQRKVIALAVVAMVFTVAAAFAVITFSPEEVPEQTTQTDTFSQVVSSYSDGEYFYTALDRGDAGLESVQDIVFYNSSDQSTVNNNPNITTIGTADTTSQNESLQISGDGSVQAFLSRQNNSVSIDVVYDDQRFNVVSNVANTELLDWKLEPGGTAIFYTLKNGAAADLYEYSVRSAEQRIVAESFIEDIGKAPTKLFHAKDKSIRAYSIDTSNIVTEYRYDYLTESTSTDSISFASPEPLRLAPDGLSPDGSLLIGRYQQGGAFIYKSLSLNSLTNRVIYQAGEGVVVSEVTWSPDSAFIAFTESTNNSVTSISQVRVGTLESTVLLDGADVADASQLTWSPMRSALGYHTGDSYKMLDIDSGEVVAIVDGVQSQEVLTAGWFNVE